MLANPWTATLADSPATGLQRTGTVGRTAKSAESPGPSIFVCPQQCTRIGGAFPGSALTRMLTLSIRTIRCCSR